MKILLNAESFGFGPSAAISSIFPFIDNLDCVTLIDYVGNGHSIDLQKSLPYNKIHSLTDNIENNFKTIVKNYDLFITALDFEKATWAREVGVKTIIYDTLLWYWRKIPAVLEMCDVYITQNFYGVEEKLKTLHCRSAIIIPPLIKQINKGNLYKKELVLINFGGLENPHWSIDVTVNYIKNILDILLPLLVNEKVKVICSQSHLPYLQNYPIMNSNYEQTQLLLMQAKLLIATPGLGNIYESANYQLNSLFLPPVNDSQGQQLQILIEKRLIDNSIDWSDINLEVQYKEQQINVLNNIANNIALLQTIKVKEQLKSIFESKITDSLMKYKKHNHDLYMLIDQFGVNGHDKIKTILQTTINDMNEMDLI